MPRKTPETPKSRSIKDAFSKNPKLTSSKNNCATKNNNENVQSSPSVEYITSIPSTETIENIKNIEEVKSTLLLMAKSLESLASAQTSTGATTVQLTNDLEDLSAHVNNQITNLEDELAIHKSHTEDKLMSLKVTADIRYSKQFLKIFIKDDKRMKEVTRVNAAAEASKILHELKLSTGSSRIVKGETKYEKRNLFGTMKFIKYIVITFNDLVTAETVLADFLKQKRNDQGKSGKDKHDMVGSNSLYDKYYLEIPSTFEMRKILAACRELKNEENIEKVVYGPSSIKTIMKKKNAEDDDEIPKKYEVTSYAEIDSMRKKFQMKNSEIPSKQIFTKDYWQKKRESTGKNNMTVKRRRDKSFDLGSTSSKRDKKDIKNNSNMNITSDQSMDSSLEQFQDTDQ